MQVLAHRLDETSVRLPIFGQWLPRDATPPPELAGAQAQAAPSPRALARTIRTVRGEDASLGTHSVRWGAAAALLRAGAPRPLVTQALWHAFARSDEPDVLESHIDETMYVSSQFRLHTFGTMDESDILESAKLTAVAEASRIPSPTDPLALPQRVGLGPVNFSAPPQGGLCYFLRELLSMAARARWGPGWPAGWPSGLPPAPGPSNGNLRRLWLGPASARLLVVDDIADRCSATCSHRRLARTRSSSGT